MKRVILAVCMCMLCLSACGEQGNDISQFAEQPDQGGQRQVFANMENSVRGKVVSLDDSKIVIELAEQPQMPQGGGQRPQGEEGGQPPQGQRQPREGGQPPQDGERQPREGGQPPQEGGRQQRVMPEMKLTGEKGEYSITPDTKIASGRIQQGQEQQTYSMADVTAGSNVVLQLDEAKTTVLSIRLMRSPN